MQLTLNQDKEYGVKFQPFMYIVYLRGTWTQWPLKIKENQLTKATQRKKYMYTAYGIMQYICGFFKSKVLFYNIVCKIYVFPNGLLLTICYDKREEIFTLVFQYWLHQ